MKRRIGSTVLVLEHTDLTTVHADALVNAANAALAGGGGVDGALHRAGGPAIAEACRALPWLRPGVRCPTGQVRSTTAGNLPARYLLHAVGPIYDSREPKTSEALLRSTYDAALAEAMRLGCRSIAFPSISTGAFRFPIRTAARIAIRAVLDTVSAHPAAFDTVHFALFSASDLAVYEGALEASA